LLGSLHADEISGQQGAHALSISARNYDMGS